jgi:tetratricopeptide (TPR) repeat protein
LTSSAAELCSPEHADTFETQERLALVLSQEQKYTEAEALARHTLTIRERILGRNNRDALIAAHTLAEILDQQGRYTDALLFFKRAYVETEKLLGGTHPDTIEFLNDNNRAKSRQQEWAQEYGDTGAGAEERYRQELSTEHVGTTNSLKNAYCAKNRHLGWVQEHDCSRDMQTTSFGQQEQWSGLAFLSMSAQPIAL